MKERQYEPFLGRFTRKIFWCWLTPIIVLNLLASVTDSYLVEIYLITLIPLTLIFFCVQVGRLHDLGYSGWLIFLNVIPIVNIGVLIALAFIKGKNENNKYGPSPYSE